jgi:AraC-like DNA-binding protein
MAQAHTLQPGSRIRAAVLSHYFEVAGQLGLNPQSLLRKVGLTRAMLAAPAAHIPVTAVVDLLEDSAATSACSTFGLQLAEARQLADFGPIALLLSHQPTLRAALSTIQQYRHLLNESLAMYVEDSGKLTLIREEVGVEGRPQARQATELAVGVLLLIFRTALGPHWHPQAVHFVHTAPEDLQVYRRLFRCPIHFESDFSGLVCATADLDRPNTQADAAMARYAQSFLDALPGPAQHSIVFEVRKSIYLLLPMGRASVEQIAQGLGMNVRTLQRRLEESAVSFSDLINEVRRELAHRYITATAHPLGRIAEQLGYSNQSSFTRWFIGQFDTTPTELRSRPALRRRS